MEETILYPLLVTLVFIAFIALVFKQLLRTSKGAAHNLPPSPPGLPFIGHLHLLKEPVHRALQTISQKYGHVVYLNFGTRPVVLVSSSSAVEECFTKNDMVFANRPRLSMGKYFGYNHNTVISAPYGDHWRNLRKISSKEMLSLNRLTMSAVVRRDEVLQMVKKLFRYSTRDDYSKVEFRSVVSNLTFNIMMRMLAGKTYYGEGVENVEEAKEFTDIVRQVSELAGASHPGDFLPLLGWIDYDGYVKRIRTLARKADGFFQGLIDEHRSELSSKGNNEETVISRLLFLQKSEPEYYTDETIKGLILALLLAGTDTSAATLEWAMSVLLNHAHVLDNIKSEIDNETGDGQLIDESDLPKLQYLQNVISETLRMFPVAPLLVPHVSSQDCQIGGFDIPCGTMLLVNVWAIHRDPNLWDDPAEFRPERFTRTDPDLQYRLMPFGLGRRGCPGATLGNRVVALALGSLVQCFEWKRVTENEVDLTEASGLTMPKAQPLEAMYKARSIITSKLL